jgi:hypothetical protein
MKHRIIYGCPASNTPTGGVKVIYRHAALLHTLYDNAFVWHVNESEFRCNWFDHSAQTISTDKLSPATDIIVIPEIWASHHVNMLKELGFKVCIFVQNAYMTHVNLSSNNSRAILDAYKEADLILSISEDSSEYIKNVFGVTDARIIQQCCSVDSELFKPNQKNKTITYMPRKMSQHSVRVVSALQPLLPEGWEISAIDNMTEPQVADILSKSIIFLSFSEFEGLGLPPIEAALCGNFVVGYHGQGGKDYWDEPIFHNVDQGDIRKFISATLERINLIENSKFPLDTINNGRLKLAKRFSHGEEVKCLVDFNIRARNLFISN